MAPLQRLLQRLLLLPLLAPLLVVLLVGALNPRPTLSLRLLTWTTPALPLGLWIALAAGGGAGLSAAGAALALQNTPGALRRQVRRAARDPFEDWRDPPAQAPPRPPGEDQAPRPAAGPPRAPGDPAPTVAVPFRVIRKGRNAAPTPEPVVAQATAVGDGWDAPPSDDW